MIKNVLFILFLFIAVKGFSQWSPFYICEECSTAVEGGSTVMISPRKTNPGAYLQLNSILPLSSGVLNLKTAMQYSYFFSKLESNSFYDNDTTFNINKLGILINFDFILKKQFILSPGLDTSIYTDKISNVDNMRVAATMEAGYQVNEHFTLRTKYTRGFKSIQIKGNELKINLINVGLGYIF